MPKANQVTVPYLRSSKWSFRWVRIVHLVRLITYCKSKQYWSKARAPSSFGGIRLSGSSWDFEYGSKRLPKFCELDLSRVNAYWTKVRRMTSVSELWSYQSLFTQLQYLTKKERYVENVSQGLARICHTMCIQFTACRHRRMKLRPPNLFLRQR